MLRRQAQAAMAHLHEGRTVDREILGIARDARALAERLREEVGADGGIAHDALQESVEAILLHRLVRHRPFPSPRDLAVPPEAYLAGFADLVGEVRRLALEALTRGAILEAREHLAEMDQLFRTLARFESPRAILALKPKQDSARALLERTRGDVALAGILERAGLARRGSEEAA